MPLPQKIVEIVRVFVILIHQGSEKLILVIIWVFFLNQGQFELGDLCRELSEERLDRLMPGWKLGRLLLRRLRLVLELVECFLAGNGVSSL